jgi:hypothetical protein
LRGEGWGEGEKYKFNQSTQNHSKNQIKNDAQKRREFLDCGRGGHNPTNFKPLG